jgi:diaminopimelate epimerase
MTELNFSKMHALGNDFMVVDGVAQQFSLTATQIAQLGERRTGIGFDQLLLIEPATQNKADFYYRVFNADGGEVGQCGNGARCVMQFLLDNQLSAKQKICLQTHNGFMSVEYLQANKIKASLGVPKALCLAQTLDTSAGEQTVSTVAVGNPHGVIFIDDVMNAPVETLGKELARHNYFPEGANISFVQVIDANHIAQRVWERGTGETPACGSAACAAVIVGVASGQLEATVTVQFPGGTLQVDWQGEGSPVYLTGPATTVYVGSVCVSR